MPFVPGPDGKPILRCINHNTIAHTAPDADAGAATTMEAEKSWGTILTLRVIPQQDQPLLSLQGVGVPPRLGGNVVMVDPRRGQTVRAYTCSVCGYVEFYDASIIHPNWMNERAD
jgi:hypothetical protein